MPKIELTSSHVHLILYGNATDVIEIHVFLRSLRSRSPAKRPRQAQAPWASSGSAYDPTEPTTSPERRRSGGRGGASESKPTNPWLSAPGAVEERQGPTAYGQSGNGYSGGGVPKVAVGEYGSYQKQQTPPDIPEAFLRHQQQQIQSGAGAQGCQTHFMSDHYHILNVQLMC